MNILHEMTASIKPIVATSTRCIMQIVTLYTRALVSSLRYNINYAWSDSDAILEVFAYTLQQCNGVN